jgi:hypothetical protein
VRGGRIGHDAVRGGDASHGPVVERRGPLHAGRFPAVQRKTRQLSPGCRSVFSPKAKQASKVKKSKSKRR